MPIVFRVAVVLLALVPITRARGQDSRRLADALDRAESYYNAIGPSPQPIAKWIGSNRVAFSTNGSAPWTVLDATTQQVASSDAADSAVGGPGPGFQPPLGLAYFGIGSPPPANSGPWKVQALN